ncbi:MAG TPA: Rrf2 family transcriptional regulator [Pseudolabrys sp.]|nr:Rrf2 family transcriptional regulator [Pseudolabrys sp.]
MPLVSRRDTLAIAAVIDIAINARSRPVAAKALAARHKLPPRHLEPVLQALVREGILKGVRGPHGGYALAREQKRITAEDILRAAGRGDDENQTPPLSSLIDDVVRPALADAERGFSAALRRISVEDLQRTAEKQK